LFKETLLHRHDGTVVQGAAGLLRLNEDHSFNALRDRTRTRTRRPVLAIVVTVVRLGVCRLILFLAAFFT